MLILFVINYKILRHSGTWWHLNTCTSPILISALLTSVRRVRMSLLSVKVLWSQKLIPEQYCIPRSKDQMFLISRLPSTREWPRLTGVEPPPHGIDITPFIKTINYALQSNIKKTNTFHQGMATLDWSGTSTPWHSRAM